MRQALSFLGIGILVTWAAILTDTKPISCEPGDKLTLRCPGSNGTQVSWYENKIDPENLICKYALSQPSDGIVVSNNWKGDVTMTTFGDGDSNITIKVKYPRDGQSFICADENLTKIIEYEVIVKEPSSFTGIAFTHYARIDDARITMRDDGLTYIGVNAGQSAGSVTIVWTVGDVVVGRGKTVILEAKRSWSGKLLKCSVKRRNGMESIQRTIVVYYGPIIRLYPQHKQTFVVPLGHSLIIMAEVDANPPPGGVSWRRGRPGNMGRKITDLHALEIPSVAVDDAGRFTVFASNAEQNATETINIQVMYRPSLVMEDDGQGEIKCIATPGFPRGLKFRFFKHIVEKTLVRGIAYTTTIDEGKVVATARYNQSSYQDSGFYLCSVKNDVGHALDGITVTTNSTPIVTYWESEQFIPRGQSKGIAVKFHSVPKYSSIRWTAVQKGVSRMLSNDSRTMRVTEVRLSMRFHGIPVVTTGYTAVLNVSKARFEDAGMYHVHIENDVGFVERRVYLDVPREENIAMSAKKELDVRVLIASSIVSALAAIVVAILVFIILARYGCLTYFRFFREWIPHDESKDTKDRDDRPISIRLTDIEDYDEDEDDPVIYDDGSLNSEKAKSKKRALIPTPPLLAKRSKDGKKGNDYLEDNANDQQRPPVPPRKKEDYVIYSDDDFTSQVSQKDVKCPPSLPRRGYKLPTKDEVESDQVALIHPPRFPPLPSFPPPPSLIRKQDGNPNDIPPASSPPSTASLPSDGKRPSGKSEEYEYATNDVAIQVSDDELHPLINPDNSEASDSDCYIEGPEIKPTDDHKPQIARNRPVVLPLSDGSDSDTYQPSVVSPLNISQRNDPVIERVSGIVRPLQPVLELREESPSSSIYSSTTSLPAMDEEQTEVKEVAG